MSVVDEAKHCIASGVYGTAGVGLNRLLSGLLAEIDRQGEPYWKTVAEERAAAIDKMEVELEEARQAAARFSWYVGRAAIASQAQGGPSPAFARELEKVAEEGNPFRGYGAAQERIDLLESRWRKAQAQRDVMQAQRDHYANPDNWSADDEYGVRLRSKP